MMDENEYLENTHEEYINNFMITYLFLFIPVATYVAIIYFYQEYDLLIIPIVSCAWLLFFFLIKPAYKILAKKAGRWEMKKFKLAPFGIGLLRIYWPPYQRMARKLVNEEAIKECENALEEMRDDFEYGWKQFCEWFPRIKFGRTSEQKLQLIKSGLSIAVNHEETNLLNSLEERAIRTGYALIVENNMEMEKGLRKKVERNAAYQKIGQEAFDTELEKRTKKLVQLDKKLHEGNSNAMFEELVHFQNLRIL